MLKKIYKVWPGVRNVPGVFILSHVDIYMFEVDVFINWFKRNTVCKVIKHKPLQKMYDTICERCRICLK